MEQKTLLITRPIEQANITLQTIEQAGYKGVLFPLLHYRPKPTPQLSALEIQQIQALLITSQQSLYSCLDKPALQQKPTYIVGEQTARLAKAEGFKHICGIVETGADLFQAVLAACQPKDGPILYISGKTIRVDLPTLLKTHGFEVIHHIAYHTIHVTSFSPAIKKAFQTHQIQGVLLLSPQTAHVFSTCIQRAGLGKNLEMVYVFCLSDAVAQPLACFKNAVVYTANEPNLASLMETINETLRS